MSPPHSLAVYTVLALSVVRACDTDVACSLNGVCAAGACVCDAPWGGASCATLTYAVTPASAKNIYPSSDPHNTWSGPIAGPDAQGFYHAFVPLYQPSGSQRPPRCRRPRPRSGARARPRPRAGAAPPRPWLRRRSASQLLQAPSCARRALRSAVLTAAPHLPSTPAPRKGCVRPRGFLDKVWPRGVLLDAVHHVATVLVVTRAPFYGLERPRALS